MNVELKPRHHKDGNGQNNCVWNLEWVTEGDANKVVSVHSLSKLTDEPVHYKTYKNV